MVKNQTIALLLGSWQIERTIVDYRAGERGSFVGSGTFALVDDTAGTRAHYDESGRFSFGDYVGRSSRELDFVASRDHGVVVNLRDGHVFVELNLTAGISRDEHVCRADRYEITMTAKSPDLLEEQWRVRGPQKDYVAVTTYTRTSRPLTGA